jgi:hypothetical protein
MDGGDVSTPAPDDVSRAADNDVSGAGVNDGSKASPAGVGDVSPLERRHV